MVQISIQRDGQLKGIKFNDVDATVTNILRTRISDDDAFASMATQAEAELPPGTNAVTALEDRQVGYFLPADRQTDTLAPVAKAKILFRIGDVVTRAKTGWISLDEQAPQFGYLPPSSRPPPALRPDGAPCTSHDDCASNNCYELTGFGGICGSCDEDADCALGCSPPGMLSAPPLPPSCGDGSRGAGCENDTACNGVLICAHVAASPYGFELETCSECALAADCAGGNVCAIKFDYTTQTAYRACTDPLTRGNGSICDDAGQCASGRCDLYRFPDGTTIGVCGECIDDGDCGAGETCEATSFEFGVGFASSVCE